jgi:phosphoglycerate dehydrogenase-like enzyme
MFANKRYPILELRGSTLGIVGFGDIGQAAGRLAVAFGMKVIALTQKPRLRSDLLQNFPATSDVRILDSSTTPDALNTVFAESDYILIATPLTKDTNKLIGSEQLRLAKNGAVLINVGRGPVIDESALIDALQNYPHNSQIKGAALDVTTIEPLPVDSPLWKLDNVLLSPHNMDLTTTFMLESTEFYIQEQLPRFLRALPLLNPVNVQEGY